MQITFNGKPCELAESTTVAELLTQYEVTQRQVAVEVNLELAPRDRHADWMLKDGDCVEVVTLVGGG